MQLSFSTLSRGGWDIRVASRTWGEGSKDICLVHGLLAHGYWWSWFARSNEWSGRMVALDLSGMGHSQWRDSYSLLEHAHEVAMQMDRPMWLIGHSYGGMVCYLVSVMYPEKVKGLVMIDSPLQAWAEPDLQQSYSRSFPKPKIYADKNDMYKAFVLLPSQPFPSESLKQELFLESICEVPLGYRWLFDPVLMRYVSSYGGLGELRQPIKVPMCYVAGELSALSKKADEGALLHWVPHGDFFVMPEAYHAVLLDQPLGLRQLIMRWMGEVF